jgi:hypothetical protein
MSEPGGGQRMTWALATRRGLRRSIRRMMRNIEPKHVSKLEALRQSGDYSERLQAGQNFGRIETPVLASGAETAQRTQYGTPAEAGTRE